MAVNLEIDILPELDEIEVPSALLPSGPASVPLRARHSGRRSQAETEAYAADLGVDLEHERDLVHVAAEGLRRKLPRPWQPCRVRGEEGVFYFNRKTGVSTWDHPNDESNRQMVDDARARRRCLVITLSVSGSGSRATLLGTSMAGVQVAAVSVDGLDKFGDVEDELKKQLAFDRGAVPRFVLEDATLIGFSARSKSLKDLFCGLWPECNP